MNGFLFLSNLEQSSHHVRYAGNVFTMEHYHQHLTMKDALMERVVADLGWRLLTATTFDVAEVYLLLNYKSEVYYSEREV